MSELWTCVHWPLTIWASLRGSSGPSSEKLPSLAVTISICSKEPSSSRSIVTTTCLVKSDLLRFFVQPPGLGKYSYLKLFTRPRPNLRERSAIYAAHLYAFQVCHRAMNLLCVCIGLSYTRSESVIYAPALGSFVIWNFVYEFVVSLKYMIVDLPFKFKENSSGLSFRRERL